MYANVIHSTVDMGRFKEAVGAIEGIKQRFAAMEGFQGAYWLQPIDGHGMSVSLWRDEGTARAAVLLPGSSPAPGVTIDRVETRAVIAQG